MVIFRVYKYFHIIIKISAIFKIIEQKIVKDIEKLDSYLEKTIFLTLKFIKKNKMRVPGFEPEL